jgi:hypothetical protein
VTSTPNILQRLNAVMQEVDYIQREEKKGMSYKIVSHDKVTALVRPALVKHGIVYWPSAFNIHQDGNRTQLHCKVIFANMDDRSDFIEVDSLGHGIDNQDKGPGKAISYAVKYALLKALGLETGDDPDLDQDVTHTPAPAKVERTKKEQREVYTMLDKLLNHISQTGGLDDLREFWVSNYATIETLEPNWQNELTKKKDEIKEALRGKVAA